jgi:hypothetical protein
MTGEDYRKAIEHLGMTKVGSARFFGINDKTPHNWITGRNPIPAAVSMLLRVMLHYKLSPHDILALEDRVAPH